MIRTLFATIVLCLLSSIAFADNTGFYSASIKREISATNSSSPSQLEFGKTSSTEVQALFNWSINLPEFAEVTGVDFQLQCRKPVFTGSINEIKTAWSSSSTWASLVNGLNGGEIGQTLFTIPTASGTGNVTWSFGANQLVSIVQKAADGQGFFRGIVARSGLNNTSTTDGIFDYKIKITYNNRIGGDANGDGVVNFPDFLILVRNYDACGKTWATADFNGDGCCTFADFLILSQNFGGPGELPAFP